jgi:hypothetical protein
MILLSSHQPQQFKKSCAAILFNFEMEDDTPASASKRCIWFFQKKKDTCGFLYYFIQHRIDKEHISTNNIAIGLVRVYKLRFRPS